MAQERAIGVVRTLFRHPVKSMGGEAIDASEVALRFGLVGDRAFAIRDVVAGEIRGAKKLPALLGLTARYLAPPGSASSPPVEIDLGDGCRIRSDDPDVSEKLSQRLGRAVELCARRPASDLAHYRRARPITNPEAEIREASGLLPEEAIPAMKAPPPVDLSALGEYVSPPGTYFDFFDLHLVSTGSLTRLASLAPASQIDPRRFRPNLVVDLDAPEALWPELAFVGRVVEIGEAALEITMPMMRCGMTTHAQPGLPKDPRIIRTLVRDCGMDLGVGVTVLRAGRIRTGDTIRLASS